MEQRKATQSFQDSIVWQKDHKSVLEVYSHILSLS